MAQFARPSSDITVNGGWTTQAGATSNRWTVLDEIEPANDADFIQSALAINDVYECRLSSVQPALINRLHVLRYRGRKSAIGGNVRGVIVELLQGASVIASNTHADLTAVMLDGAIVLTKEQGALITDYADLRVRFSATGTFSGNNTQRRRVEISWCQLRVPDSSDLLDDWRSRWSVPADVTTLEALIAWLEPQTANNDATWLRRHSLAIAVWKVTMYRPMLDSINAGTYSLPSHQTQQFAAAKIAGKIARFQTQSDTLDAEDTA